MDLIDEAASGFGQPDAARIAVERDDAKVLLQHLDAGADARMACAERQSGTMEAEMFRNGERLDQCVHLLIGAVERERASLLVACAQHCFPAHR